MNQVSNDDQSRGWGAPWVRSWDTHDVDHLVASVDLTLQLLDAAERQRSFPGPSRPSDAFDEENEAYKRESMKRERQRYTEIRERLGGDEAHGIPVAQEFLESALGLMPGVLADDSADELYERWLQDARRDTPLTDQEVSQ